MGSFAAEVHGLVAAGDLEAALERLLERLATASTRLRDEAILHRAMLSQNNRNVRQGMIPQADSERVRSRINLAVLSLLADAEAEERRHRDIRGRKADSPAQQSAEGLGHGGGRIRILFLSANPPGTARIRVDAELSRIATELRASAGRERISLSQRVAVTPSELLQAMLDEQPHVLHFAGHGAAGGIILEGACGAPQQAPERALENLLLLFSDLLWCVILNACHSEAQARAIARRVPYVIGMSTAIPDAAAISFSTGFYKALGAGREIEFAYRAGLSSVQLEGLAGDDIPRMFRRE